MSSVHPGIVHQAVGKTEVEYLPLEEVSVKAWVVDVSSRIVLVQTFYNPSDEPTGRAKYVFPLPASAAVCAFELELEDGSVIVGEVKEKEEATRTFTHAVEQGRTTALVESVTDDIFTLSLGSIPPTTRVTAHLTFVMDLLDEALQDHVRLQLPMYVAERYGTPPAAMQNVTAADSRTRVSISVDIQTSDVIYAVKSPTHQIALRRYKGHSGQKSQRRMSAIWKSSEFLTSDFVITIYAEGLDKPRCFAEVLGASGSEHGEGSTVAMQLTLVPKFQAPKVPSQEYIFIIDRSGSMTGASIETAKRTLTMLLRLLPSSQTTFNIFSFGTDATCLWPSGRALDQRSLVEATLHVASMSADRGGTDIPNALQSAFNSRGLDRPAVIFLLTDGRIHISDKLDPLAVISNAHRFSQPEAPVRLFVLGIGSEVSSDVCRRLAKEGNGEYLSALSAEDISGKCARLLNAGRSKNIEQIDIDWGCDTWSPQARASAPVAPILVATVPTLAPPPPVQQAPHSLTNIFSGIRFTVFAIMSPKTVPKFVRLTTKLKEASEPLELTVHVTRVKPFRDTEEHSMIPIVHTLAARKLIMALDDGEGPLPTPAPDDALLVSPADLRRAGIVRLGLTYQLLSKYTSFVAVRKGDERLRNGRRRSGRMAWVRSRLRQINLDDDEDNPPEAPTFLDTLLDTVSSFVASVFGFHGGPALPTSRTRSQQQPRFPGAYDASDSSTGEEDRGRGRGRASSPARSPASHCSADTFSTISSLEGSCCSSRWTPSRSPSPLPRFRDTIERVPSPEFPQGASARAPGGATNARPGASGPRRRAPISQEVYDLILEMNLDGSFAVSPLLARLVGDAVIGKADELGIDARVWATVVVVAYVQARLEGEPDFSELVTEKAREFVEGYGRGGRRRFDEMVRKAAQLLNR